MLFAQYRLTHYTEIKAKPVIRTLRRTALINSFNNKTNKWQSWLQNETYCEWFGHLQCLIPTYRHKGVKKINQSSSLNLIISFQKLSEPYLDDFGLFFLSYKMLLRQ